MLLRLVKTLLIAAVAAWGFVGALLNVLNWGGTTGSVYAATTMSTFEGGAASWQATANPLLILAGALFITLAKVLTGICCSIGSVQMLRTLNADDLSFNRAKVQGLVGCGIAVLMLFFGFVVVAESFFEMWRSDLLRDASLESAFRYAGLIALIAIFVGQQDG